MLRDSGLVLLMPLTSLGVKSVSVSFPISLFSGLLTRQAKSPARTRLYVRVFLSELVSMWATLHVSVFLLHLASPTRKSPVE